MTPEEDFKFLKSILAQVNVNEEMQAKMQNAYKSIGQALIPKPIVPKEQKTIETEKE